MKTEKGLRVLGPTGFPVKLARWRKKDLARLTSYRESGSLFKLSTFFRNPQSGQFLGRHCVAALCLEIAAANAEKEEVKPAAIQTELRAIECLV